MQKRTNRAIGETVFAAIGTALYTLVNGALLFFHEPWRDEAQAWLITRDLNLPGILRQIKFEGHPILWNLVLLPFAKLGFPYRWIGVISLLYMAAAVFLFLWKAPFPRDIRLISLCGAAFMYFYPVIARNYALIPPCLFLTACFYRDRHTKPVRYGVAVALLLQTHIIMAGFCGMLGLFYLIETVRARKEGARREWLALGIMALSAAALGFELFGSVGANAGVSVRIPAGIVPLARAVCTSIARIWYMIVGGALFRSPGRWDTWLIGLGTLMLLVPYLIRGGKPAWAFLVGTGFQMLLYAFVYEANEQRAVSISVMLIACIWMSADSLRAAAGSDCAGCRRAACGRVCMRDGTVALLLSAVLSVGCWAEWARDDIELPYSASAAAADCIVATLEEESILIGDSESAMTAVAAYLPRGRVYNVNRAAYYGYTTWDGRGEQTPSLESLLDAAGTLQSRGGAPVYLVLCTKQNRQAASTAGLECIGDFRESMATDETYTIFRAVP